MELRRQWSFGIGALLPAMAGVAVGLATATGERGQIDQGLLAAVSTWFVFSLLSQAARQWSDYRNGRGAETKARKWGRRLEIGWRIVVAAALVALVVFNLLKAREVLPTPPLGTPARSFDRMIQRGMHMLCLIFVVGSASSLAVRRVAIARRRWLKIPWNVIAWCGIFAFGAFMIFDQGMVHFVVLIAVEGIEVSMTRWHLPDPPLIRFNQRHNEFFTLSLAAAILSVANLLLLSQTMRLWALRRPSWRRTLAATVLTVPTVVFPFWTHYVGYSRLSPFFADVPSELPARAWFETAILIGMAAFAIVYSAWRAASSEAANAPSPPRSREHAAGRYFHAGRLGAASLAAALLMSEFYDLIHDLVTQESQLTWFDAQVRVYGSTNQFSLAALAAAVAATFRRRSHEGVASLEQPPDVALGRFLALWLFATISLAFALACLAIFSFGVWLAPVFRS